MGRVGLRVCVWECSLWGCEDVGYVGMAVWSGGMGECA